MEFQLESDSAADKNELNTPQEIPKTKQRQRENDVKKVRRNRRFDV